MSSLPAPPRVPADSLTAVGPVGLMVVSSNPDLRRDLLERLESDHWLVVQSGRGAEGREKVGCGQASLVLLDPGLPDLEVDEFKAIVHEQYPGVMVIPINPHTGQPMIMTPSPDSICFEIVRKIERGSPFRPGTGIPARVSEEEEFPQDGLPGFLGISPPVRRMCAMARLVAQRDTTVLITGECGTSKDVVARALHQLGTRRMKPFVVMNCAVIPEALLEAELFGFAKGAFTGAVQSRIGRIHAAHGGTLFLDEIGDLPLGLQSKLLRFLDQGEVQRLGSSDVFRVDVRIVAATNANLGELTAKKQFREDLYYRLSVFPIELP